MNGYSLRFLPLLMLAALLASSCTPIHYETSRSVTVDRARGQVAILRHGHYVAAVSPEGSFPEWNNRVNLMFLKPLPEHGTFVLRIPEDAKAEFGEIESGELELNLDALKATVHFMPHHYHRYLKLNGSYPVALK